MPRKIRELIADLETAGFENRGGKGSHLVEQWEFEDTLVSGQKEALELVCAIGDAWRERLN